MIEHASHIPFIVAAYAIAGIVIGTMIGMIALDYRALKRALGRFGSGGWGPRGADSRGLDRE